MIDLGANSESEDEGELLLLQNDGGETQPPPLVKIKREPMDAGEEFEEEHEVYYPPERGSEFDEEIERLEKVEENIDEDLTQIYKEKSKTIVIDPDPNSKANSPCNEAEKNTEVNESGSDGNNDDVNDEETIDLGENSDSADEEELQNEVSETRLPSIKITSELKEKSSEIDKEVERLKEVKDNLEGNITPKHVDKSKAKVMDAVPTIDNSVAYSLSNTTKEAKESKSGTNNDLNTVETNKEAIVIDDEDDSPCSEGNALKVNFKQLDTSAISNNMESLEKDRHISETTDSRIDRSVNSNGVIAEITSVASAGIKVENVDDVIEKDLSVEPLTFNVLDQQLPVISMISSAGIKIERDLSTSEYTGSDNYVRNTKNNSTENLNQRDEITDALPMSFKISSQCVKVEIEHMEDDIKPQNLKSDTEQCSIVNDVVGDDPVNKPVDLPVIPKAEVFDLNDFGDMPMNLNFADDGICFADDGIAYIEEDEDEDNIITVKGKPY